MAIATNDEVKIVYLNGTAAPTSSLSDYTDGTIYVMPEKHAIYVGTTLIVENFTGTIPEIEVSGTGNYIASATYSGNKLTLTYGTLPTLSESGTTDSVSLQGGGTFSAVHNLSVSDHTITDTETTFTLPNIVNSIAQKQTGGSDVVGTVTITQNGTAADLQIFNPADYVASTNGTATNLTADQITITGTPSANSTDAATTAYVDNAISNIPDPMHFKGVTTTPLTDGSTTNTIVIEGNNYNAKSGDVVLYDGLEFVWTGTQSAGHWVKFGDESSYALKTTTVSGDDGLTGGGALSANQTIKHAVPTGASAGTTTTDISTTGKFEVITSVTTDKFGHTTGISKTDGATQINSLINTKIATLDYTDSVAGDYVTSVNEADGVISVTKGSKGSVASGNTGLVDGGTVYTAVEAAKLKWTVITPA